ncbi:sensor histidine kinase [Sedimentibacter sp. MB31-C6]|uniref:sensor histidine kinase n=1 Tax=Sedimentibacter sp. MB31-C6 TaxID=3109366 RepID=UPI002DDD5BD4|nr:ATP-binding protein [Sedimentibacter sp. MB36-C1]WSI04754.1 ATP-binding protein [Sedimentibacter sp. MB36-C1]
MRIDIENKILIPYMILLILSIIIIGIVSYWNGYRLLLENEIKHSLQNLEEIILFIEESNNNFIDEDEAKSYVIDYYNQLEKDNLVIFNNEDVLINNYNNDNDWILNIENEILNSNKQSIYMEDYIFTYEDYEYWNWTIGYRLNKGIFSNEVLESQKYMILIAIVSLVLSMQAAIFISYNISKPIKILADACDKIVDQGSFNEKIKINRKDEIGTLSKAFNNMLFRLQNNTKKLIEVTKFNEDILKNISAGIITTNYNGQILSINQAAEDFFSHNIDKNIKKEIKESLSSQINETLDSNKKINRVIKFNNIEKSNEVYLDVTTSLLKRDEKTISGAICNFYDISERKKIENKMDSLDRLTSIGQFAAGIAHEVRNPLAGMKTSIQVLKNRLCKNDIANKKLFNGVLYEIDRINKLISSLLDFAKPRIANKEKTNLVEILDNSLELIKKIASESNIDIKIINNSTNSTVFVDKAQVEQIFLNIIKNALSAIDKNGNLNIIFKNYIEENICFIQIDFIDNGCGIHPENIEKIFNPFFTTNPKGTGLGLSVVHELIKSNDGEIKIKSIINEGTKIEIKFPTIGGINDEV